jgi:hypothetical protein
MSYNIPKIKIETLNEYYKELISHPTFTSWRENYDKSLGFYSGDLIINSNTKALLEQQEIDPISCNLIAQNVNSLCGIEIQNSYRIKVNVTNDTADARNFEDAINQYLMDLQNDQVFESAVRSAFKDAIIGGLGFVLVRHINRKPEVYYINPYNIVIDFRDSSRMFERQQVIFTWEDLHQNEIKRLYGVGNYNRLRFDNKFSQNGVAYANTVEVKQRLQTLASSMEDTEFQNRVFTAYCVEIVDGWQGNIDSTDDNKTIIKTVDPQIGIQLPNAEKVPLSVVIKTSICQGKILKQELDGPVVIDGQIPIIPMVYQRGYNFEPKGLVSQIEEVQEGFNIALSRMNAYANTSKTIATIANANVRQEFVENPQNAIKPNAVLALAPGDRVDVIHPTEAITQQKSLLEAHMLFMKRACGIEDETKGIQTNAVSGIAQQQRDINSMRTNAFVFDNFKAFKKRIGKIVLQQLQYSYDTDIVVNLMDGDKRKNIILNNIIEYGDGTYEVINDISAQRFNISIEQTPDEYTTRAQKQAEFKAVLPFLTNPSALVLLQSKKFVEWLGISNPDELIQELRQIQTNLLQDGQPLETKAAQVNYNSADSRLARHTVL